MNYKFVEYAIKESEKAFKKNEIPVGAIIVKDDKIISKAHNLCEKKHSILNHAELIAIDKASKKIGDWRLDDCTMYVTLFPCTMCAAAIKRSRISKIVYLTDTNNLEELKITNDIFKNANIEIVKLQNDHNLLNAFFKKIRYKFHVKH